MSNRRPKRSLQRKVSIALAAVITVLGVFIYLTLYSIVAPAFDQLEAGDARTNLIRAQRAIDNDLANLSAITGD